MDKQNILMIVGGVAIGAAVFAFGWYSHAPQIADDSQFVASSTPITPASTQAPDSSAKPIVTPTVAPKPVSTLFTVTPHGDTSTVTSAKYRVAFDVPAAWKVSDRSDHAIAAISPGADFATAEVWVLGASAAGYKGGSDFMDGTSKGFIAAAALPDGQKVAIGTKSYTKVKTTTIGTREAVIVTLPPVSSSDSAPVQVAWVRYEGLNWYISTSDYKPATFSKPLDQILATVKIN